uniref:WSC domain-containing protein n=2 Tax=Chlamydomonas euryale TaxID=1486919 RepID=A0A7R9YVB6_9CHLO|mmetsp:Transcript_30184/g.89572  ORF Transcript_30184/g.89572 Transcript_30184/m.89572 type:complete len:934 (+) Transcript_30184:182-2983(+)
MDDRGQIALSCRAPCKRLAFGPAIVDRGVRRKAGRCPVRKDMFAVVTFVLTCMVVSHAVVGIAAIAPRGLRGHGIKGIHFDVTTVGGNNHLNGWDVKRLSIQETGTGGDGTLAPGYIAKSSLASPSASSQVHNTGAMSSWNAETAFNQLPCRGITELTSGSPDGIATHGRILTDCGRGHVFDAVLDNQADVYGRHDHVNGAHAGRGGIYTGELENKARHTGKSATDAAVRSEASDPAVVRHGKVAAVRRLTVAAAASVLLTKATQVHGPAQLASRHDPGKASHHELDAAGCYDCDHSIGTAGSNVGNGRSLSGFKDRTDDRQVINPQMVQSASSVAYSPKVATCFDLSKTSKSQAVHRLPASSDGSTALVDFDAGISAMVARAKQVEGVTWAHGMFRSYGLVVESKLGMLHAAESHVEVLKVPGVNMQRHQLDNHTIVWTGVDGRITATPPLCAHECASSPDGLLLREPPMHALSCPNGSVISKVVAAFYGDTGGNECSEGAARRQVYESELCGWPEVLSHSRLMCIGQRVCLPLAQLPYQQACAAVRPHAQFEFACELQGAGHFLGAEHFSYIDCFLEDNFFRALPVHLASLMTGMGASVCAQLAFAAGMPYFGMQKSPDSLQDECWAGPSSERMRMHGKSDGCTMQCAGAYEMQCCGGLDRIVVYKLHGELELPPETTSVPMCGRQPVALLHNTAWDELGCWRLLDGVQGKTAVDVLGWRLTAAMASRQSVDDFLDSSELISNALMTTELCRNFSMMKRRAFFSTLHGNACWVSDDISVLQNMVKDSEACHWPCAGSNVGLEHCGGKRAMQLYALVHPRRTKTEVAALSMSSNDLQPFLPPPPPPRNDVGMNTVVSHSTLPVMPKLVIHPGLCRTMAWLGLSWLGVVARVQRTCTCHTGCHCGHCFITTQYTSYFCFLYHFPNNFNHTQFW